VYKALNHDRQELVMQKRRFPDPRKLRRIATTGLYVLFFVGSAAAAGAAASELIVQFAGWR
jgi:hypothetical protein